MESWATLVVIPEPRKIAFKLVRSFIYYVHRIFVDSDLGKRIKQAELHLAKLKKSQGILHATSTHTLFVFKVEVISLWANEGEQSVTVQKRATLKKIFSEALAEFMRVNRRSDVQAAYRVSLVLAEDTEVFLPEKFWEKYKYHRPTSAATK